MTVVQSLPLTIGLANKRMVVLDTLRRQRNAADYTGDDIDESTAEHCIVEARRLVDDVLAWRKAHRRNSTGARDRRGAYITQPSRWRAATLRG
jgi:hypothetical protein